MEQDIEIGFVPNPFASFMDPSACVAAHIRLARLPQAQHRPLDKPRIRTAIAAAEDMEDDDMVVTETADLDDFGCCDVSDILSMSDPGSLC
jgi:hypothetical protein